MNTQGLHHVTGIAGDPQRNLDFYAGLLGLRFVKKTVNFDDPYTYHFYFGDGQGSPGSVMTFFPWASAGYPGRPGTGQTEAVAFAVPARSMRFWQKRLSERGVVPEDAGARFGEPVIGFRDPDGQLLELVGVEDDARAPWTQEIPAEHAIRGFHSVTLLESADGPTAQFLREQLGMRQEGQEGQRFRFSSGGPAGIVDLRIDPSVPPGRWGRGTIHHVAFRTQDDGTQRSIREQMVRSGIQVTPVADRQYFRSIYFHEPGGVLFEIATDGPGFAIDEEPSALGTSLKLPAWYEDSRPVIESRLPFVVHPATLEA